MSPNSYKVRDSCRKNLVKYTMKAFSLIPPIDNPVILDMGCGTGEPALALLEICNGKIYAVDSDIECVSVLNEKAKTSGHADRIKVINGSVFDRNMFQNQFDIVLAEGLLNILGFETGLPLLINFLKQRGYLIIHDQLQNDAKKRALFTKYNLNLLDAFELDENIWWNEYYCCLERSIDNIEDTLCQKEINEIIEYKKDPENCRSIYYIVARTQPESAL
ncbi:class I SAM-dependent methyltransferase [Desulfosporosinus nitroreducens]|uniref:class I SAM-dependent methyltransferase n=1 Tax=Desulfosporosinus nitroreducens TaxID=2018668 RepID=UPI00207CD058|nr:class I SAM-dependent methyltransferase [Desulfosporosinus nitroreducens]MCO1604383.1 class I SAM-dependent methyltransferase [Desulfosporosinus nitroreducens]